MHYEVELALIMGKELRDFDGKDEKAAIDAIDSMSPWRDFAQQRLSY